MDTVYIVFDSADWKSLPDDARYVCSLHLYMRDRGENKAGDIAEPAILALLASSSLYEVPGREGNEKQGT